MMMSVLIKRIIKKYYKNTYESPFMAYTLLGKFLNILERNPEETQTPLNQPEELTAFIAYLEENDTNEAFFLDYQRSSAIGVPHTESQILIDKNNALSEEDLLYLINAYDYSQDTDMLEYAESIAFDKFEFPWVFNSDYIVYKSLPTEIATRNQTSILKELAYTDISRLRNSTAYSFLLDDGPRPHNQIAKGRHWYLDFLQDNFVQVAPAVDKQIIETHEDMVDNYPEPEEDNENHMDYTPSIFKKTFNGLDWSFVFLIIWFFLLKITISTLDAEGFTFVYKLFFSKYWFFMLVVWFYIIQIEYWIGVLVGKIALFDSDPDGSEWWDLEEYAPMYDVFIMYMCMFLVNWLDVVTSTYYRYLTGLRTFSIIRSIPNIRAQLYISIYSIMKRTPNTYLNSLTHSYCSLFFVIILYFYYATFYFFYFILGSFNKLYYVYFLKATSKYLFIKGTVLSFYNFCIEYYDVMVNIEDSVGYLFLEVDPVTIVLELFFLFSSILGLLYSRFSYIKVNKLIDALEKKHNPEVVFSDPTTLSAMYPYMRFYLNGAVIIEHMKRILPIYLIFTIIYVKNCWGYLYFGHIFGKYVFTPAELYRTDGAIRFTSDLFGYLKENYATTNTKIAYYGPQLNDFFESSITGGWDATSVFLFFILKSCIVISGFWTIVIYYIYYYYSLLYADQEKNESATSKYDTRRILKPGYSVINIPRPEFIFTLVFIAALGVFSLSTTSVLVMIMCLECLTLATCYAISNLPTVRSTDAAVKYFIISAIASCLLLYGAAFIYMSVGTLDLIKVSQILVFSIDKEYSFIVISGFLLFLLSFFIKLSAFPFFGWSLDIYSLCDIPTLFFISVFSKFLLIFLFFKFFLLYGFAVFSSHAVATSIVISLLSVICGSFGVAYVQEFRRFVAWSSIMNFGYILLLFTLIYTNCALETLVTYLVNYLLVNMVLFAILARFSVVYTFNLLTDFSKLQLEPLYVVYAFIALLSLAGVPPFLGFFSKVFIFNTIYVTHLGYSFAVFTMLLSVPAYYGYFKAVRNLFYLSTPDGRIFKAEFLTESEQTEYDNMTVYFIQDPIDPSRYLKEFEILLANNSKLKVFSQHNLASLANEPVKSYGTFNYGFQCCLNFFYAFASICLTFGSTTSSYIIHNVFILSKANTSKIYLIDSYDPIHAFTFLDFIRDCSADLGIFVMDVFIVSFCLFFCLFFLFLVLSALKFLIDVFLHIFWDYNLLSLLADARIPYIATDTQHSLYRLLLRFTSIYCDIKNYLLKKK